MLNAERINRMIASKTLCEAAKILQECGWDDDVINNSPEKVDLLVARELARTVDTFTKLCTSKDLLGLVFSTFVYHNAAVYYNAELRIKDASDNQRAFIESTVEDSIYPLVTTVLSAQQIRNSIQKRNYEGLPKFLAEVFAELDRIPAPTPTQVEVAINRALYKDIFAKTKRIGNKIIKEFYVAQLDILNIKNFAKLRIQGGEEQDIYISGGTIGKETLQEVLRKDLHFVKTALTATKYESLVEVLLRGIESADLGVFETVAHEYLNKIATREDGNVFSIAMTFAWFVKKLEEIRIVKILLTGKKFGASRDDLRERLRRYV